MDLIKRIQEYSRDVGCIRFCKRHNAFNNEVGIPMEMVLPCLDCPKPAGNVAAIHGDTTLAAQNGYSIMCCSYLVGTEAT